MLNTLAAEGAATTSPSGHMTGHVTPDMGSQGHDMGDQEPKKKIKRRNSSISGSPLNDQGEFNHWAVLGSSNVGLFGGYLKYRTPQCGNSSSANSVECRNPALNPALSFASALFGKR